MPRVSALFREGGKKPGTNDTTFNSVDGRVASLEPSVRGSDVSCGGTHPTHALATLSDVVFVCTVC